MYKTMPSHWKKKLFAILFYDCLFDTLSFHMLQKYFNCSDSVKSILKDLDLP